MRLRYQFEMIQRMIIQMLRIKNSDYIYFCNSRVEMHVDVRVFYVLWKTVLNIYDWSRWKIHFHFRTQYLIIARKVCKWQFITSRKRVWKLFLDLSLFALKNSFYFCVVLNFVGQFLMMQNYVSLFNILWW